MNIKNEIWFLMRNHHTMQFFQVLDMVIIKKYINAHHHCTHAAQNNFCKCNFYKYKRAPIIPILINRIVQSSIHFPLSSWKNLKWNVFRRGRVNLAGWHEKFQSCYYSSLFYPIFRKKKKKHSTAFFINQIYKI